MLNTKEDILKNDGFGNQTVDGSHWLSITYGSQWLPSTETHTGLKQHKGE